eukprot:3219521-Rhodomonas_salina.1
MEQVEPGTRRRRQWRAAAVQLSDWAAGQQGGRENGQLAEPWGGGAVGLRGRRQGGGSAGWWGCGSAGLLG